MVDVRRLVLAATWFAVPLAAIVVLPSEHSWAAPTAAFVLVVTATVLCTIGAVAVWLVSWRRGLAEPAILGSALFTASVLPLAHGLTIPGVLYGPNAAVMTTAFLAVPTALLVAAPVAIRQGALARAAARHWRTWSVAGMVLSAALAAVFLLEPEVLAAPMAGSVTSIVVTAAALGGTGVLVKRQLRLYRIGRRVASLVTALGLGYLGLSTLVWISAEPFTLAWWAAHAVDAAGVLAATVGLVAAHHRDRDLMATLAPVVNRDPLTALELGLTPLVHRFIAALAQKDAVTRDHVVRVAELAMRCGLRAGLDGNELRAVGLGALLHDVGKLDTPQTILAKTGALTADEFAIVKGHTVVGDALMRTSPILVPAAPVVRWHHERVDGTGYPDGLAGDAIPLAARLVSVCDAWDAMTSTRPYRQGMAAERAREILREHAGSQWCDDAVALVISETTEHGFGGVPAFDRVGVTTFDRAQADLDDLVVECLDALPRELVHR